MLLNNPSEQSLYNIQEGKKESNLMSIVEGYSTNKVGVSQNYPDPNINDNNNEDRYNTLDFCGSQRCLKMVSQVRKERATIERYQPSLMVREQA